MAKHRVGKKKGRKGGKRAKRKAQGRKLARYNKLRHRFGKAKARALVFGKGKKGKKGHKKAKHRARKGKIGTSAKRRAAGKRLWNLMKKRHGGHAGAVRYLRRCQKRALCG